MRNAFADEITRLGKADERIVLLSGDIGNKLFDNFKKIDEKRFYNCGVAEANMMSVAAGMALSGLRPVVYTIAPFTTTRCFEQIRVDVCYHEAPVVIVGTGSGLCYASLGPTHHSLEDMAILRTLPGMRVLAPCDATELRLALQASLKEDGPVYIRIGKKGEPAVHTTPPDFRLGQSIVVRRGTDVALLFAGIVAPEAMKAADLLASKGISAELVSFHTVKPLDESYLQQAVNRFRVIASIEEHGAIGGFGSAIAEWCVTHDADVRQLIFGARDEFLHETGSQEYARARYGLTAENVAAQVATALRGI